MEVAAASNQSCRFLLLPFLHGVWFPTDAGWEKTLNVGKPAPSRFPPKQRFLELRCKHYYSTAQ